MAAVTTTISRPTASSSPYFPLSSQYSDPVATTTHSHLMSPRLQTYASLTSSGASFNQPSSPTSSYSSSTSFHKATRPYRNPDLLASLPPPPPISALASDSSRTQPLSSSHHRSVPPPLPPPPPPPHHHQDTEDNQSDSSVRSHGVKRSYDTYAATRPQTIKSHSQLESLPQPLPSGHSTLSQLPPLHPTMLTSTQPATSISSTSAAPNVANIFPRPPAPSISIPNPTSPKNHQRSSSTSTATIPISAPIPVSSMVSNLATLSGRLSNASQPAPIMPESRFTLHLRQNPRAARAGPDGKDRRTIDPPPVLQLLIDDFDPQSEKDIASLKAHDWVVHAKLISAEAPHEDLTTIASHPERGHNTKVTRLLLGTTVSSPFFCTDDPDSDNAPQHPITKIAPPPSPTAEILKIPNRNRNAPGRGPDAYKTFPGAFFIFPDLSIRKAGQYRLEFRLMKMTPDVLIPGRIVPTISIAVSDVFNVVNAKDFDQVQPSTDLVKGLLDRGAGFPLKLKKGLREGQKKKGRSGDSDDDDDDGDGDGDGEGELDGREGAMIEVDDNEDDQD